MRGLKRRVRSWEEIEGEVGGRGEGVENSSHMHPPVPGPWQAGEK